MDNIVNKTNEAISSSELPMGRPINKNDVKNLVEKKKIIKKQNIELQEKIDKKENEESEKKKKEFKNQLKTEILKEIMIELTNRDKKSLKEITDFVVKEIAKQLRLTSPKVSK